MAVVELFCIAIFTNLWVYGTGLGPVALDALAQVFIRPYREWAGGHGPIRRWFIAGIAVAGFVWASFAAFQQQYAATQSAIDQRNAESGKRNWWAGLTETRRVQINDGGGALQKQLVEKEQTIAGPESQTCGRREQASPALILSD